MKRHSAIVALVLIAAAACLAATAIFIWALYVPPSRRYQEREARRLGLPIERPVDLPFGRRIEMVFIPAGEFLMGGAEGEPEHKPDESPKHRVRISKPFYMSACEVTQDQYLAVLRREPSRFAADPRNPVDSVSWDDAQAFCRRAGHGFRLPTEAEWEYACRAGSTSLFGVAAEPGYLLTWAWFRDNSGDRPHPVGGKRANAWGLYDMLGNVWEWCQDRYGPYEPNPSVAVDPAGPQAGELRVHRGGAFNSDWTICRCANRSATHGDSRSDNFGFRVVTDIPSAK